MIPKEILRKVRHIEIRTRHVVNDLFAGQYHSAFKGQGMEFQEVRPYFPGDDIRSIDWNVTARMNEPFIKKFQEERELTVLLVVDISASHAFGSTANMKKDIAAEIAAILAFAAIQNNDKVGMILHTNEVEHYIAPQKGTRHVLRVISDVLNFEPAQKGTRITPALDFINHITLRKSIIFLIGDFLLPLNFERPLAVTAKRHDVVSVLVGDRREQTWPKAGIIEWEDAETGARYLLDSSDNYTRREVSRLFLSRREKLLKLLRKIDVDTIEVKANEPYEKEFFKFFRQRAHRLRS